MCRYNAQNKAVGCDMAEVLRVWLTMAEHRIRNSVTSCEVMMNKVAPSRFLS